MADSSSFRPSRAGGLPPRRDEPSADPARDALSDPLAELARLIGQDEAFGAIVRNTGRQEPRAEPRAEPPPVDTSPPAWRARSGQPQAARERDDRYSPAPPDEGASRFPRHPLDPQPRAPASAPVHEPSAHDAHGYGAHGYQAPPAGEDTGDAGHAQAHPAAPAHDAAGEYYGEGGDGHDGHYEGEEDYADAVPERRRGGLVIVASVIGLALVGTAGAFGYWAWSAGPGGRSEPPLIKADTTPNKVVPATQAGDAAGNKRIYDRAGGDKGGSAERVVPREETPADVPTPPRQVYPSVGGVYGPAPASQPPAAAPAPTAAPASQPSGVPPTGAPRVVHTETIRPGQVASADLSQPVAPPLAAAVPSPAPAPPAKQPAARAKQGAPVALADTPPATRSTAPTGGYVVQLSSQRSEEEAMASFKALATKYAAVFGDRQPLIKRADLGDKGVYYRAQVGPFPNQDQANHFCSNLKIAGGQCIVQKN
jgi:hypothetical protein